MTKRITSISPRQAAIVAGVGLLIMTILAPVAEFFVRQSLIVPGDAATTANNIADNELLFRGAICIYLSVAILDMIVAWALYVLLEPVHKSLALLAAWFRLVYAAIFAIALHNFFSVLLLLSGADYMSVYETAQLHAQVMLFLDAFSYGWDIGTVIFGLHLLVLGYLVFKSGYIPKVLGVLLAVASFGYVIDSIGKFLSPDYDVTIAMFTFIGELLFTFWLLFKGSKIPAMQS